MRLNCTALRVIVHLACNPNTELLAKEVARRFHVSSGKVARDALQEALREGWLVNATGKVGRGNLVRYAAGPRLLAERGELYR